MSEEFFRKRVVSPKVREGGVNVIILDRLVEGETPPYCIHGKVQCFRCQEWCWLGDKSHDAVIDGVAPLCLQCATEVLPPDARPVTNLGDHRRADGPH